MYNYNYVPLLNAGFALYNFSARCCRCEQQPRIVKGEGLRLAVLEHMMWRSSFDLAATKDSQNQSFAERN